MPIDVEQILELFETRGAEMYGREPVSQLEHALQCAHQAESNGAEASLVSACLLHDLGHLLAKRNDGELAEAGTDVDDIHQYFALPFLRGVFPDAVLEPIKLHVDAKRYLCCVESGYWGTLSNESKHSLELQGGIFSTAQAEEFIRQPYAYDAVLLRRWDDLAKVPGKGTPEIEHFRTFLEASMR